MTNNPTEQQADKTKEPPLSQQVSSDDSSSLYQKLKALPMKHYPKQTLGEYLADAELDAIMQLFTEELEKREREANTTSEEELDEILAKHGAEAGELTASLKDALLAWRDAAVVEALS